MCRATSGAVVRLAPESRLALFERSSVFVVKKQQIHLDWTMWPQGRQVACLPSFLVSYLKKCILFIL